MDSAAVRLAHLVSPTGPSLTLAPEAGSQRMRDIINKNVSEADVLAAAEEAFRSGRTTLKLYFMIGLPLETDADVVAIADLCLRVRDLGRRMLGSRAGRLQLNVSVNNFVPKPFTPFQWAGMADRGTLRRRQDMLRSRLRKPGVRLALHDVEKSYLEAALARGGEEMGGVIEEAWRRGARFDSWTEQFRGEAWREALASAGTSAEELATATIPRDLPLPWDVILGVVERDFLWAEWERALSGESTADCRWGGCSDCGVCVAATGQRLGREVRRGAGAHGRRRWGGRCRRAVLAGGFRRAPSRLTERHAAGVSSLTFSVTGTRQVHRSSRPRGDTPPRGTPRGRAVGALRGHAAQAPAESGAPSGRGGGGSARTVRVRTGRGTAPRRSSPGLRPRCLQTCSCWAWNHTKRRAPCRRG